MHVQGLNTVEFWQSRAVEARAVAEAMHEPVARATMLGIAARYENMADRAAIRRAEESLSSERSNVEHFRSFFGEA
jgi:hypothetical protein